MGRVTVFSKQLLSGYCNKEPELQYPERSHLENAPPIVLAQTTIHYPQPQYPVPDFMREEPFFMENLWHRLEVEEHRYLQMVEV